MSEKKASVTIYLTCGDKEEEATFSVREDDNVVMKLKGEEFIIKRKSLRFLNAFMDCYPDESDLTPKRHEVTIEKSGWYAVKLPNDKWDHVELKRGDKVCVEEIIKEDFNDM